MTILQAALSQSTTYHGPWDAQAVQGLEAVVRGEPHACITTHGAQGSSDVQTSEVNFINQAVDVARTFLGDWEECCMATTYTKLKSGEWGMRIEGPVTPGDEVTVTKKSGETKVEVVGKVVWANEEVSLCTIAGQKDGSEDVPF